ncbi:MAG: ribosome biogenesis GTPase YlqF [Bacilli bacterium]|nr:ribosome biogenesis GTPase YlqF [Bacilli bacterium]
MENKTNINWYPGHMAKTKRLISESINLIDVVFEVVDARMPHSSKIRDIDKYINNKPRIIIMTKIDLCDMKETQKWIDFYENKGYKVISMDLNKNFNMNIIIKATNEIMKNIHDKRLAKEMNIRKTRILVVGIPNAGKSTLINRLASKKAVKIGNRPGVTKTLDWIRINNDLELLDTPGILWPKLDNQTVALNLASLTAIKEEVLPLDEVALHIIKTLYQYYPKILQSRYGITEIDFDDILATYDIIGKKRGCLIKGGLIDYDKVITVIINDIKEGNIKGITFDRFGEESEVSGN